MTPPTAKRMPAARVFLVTVTVLLASACATADSQDESVAALHPHPLPAMASRPVVVTLIKTKAGQCKAEYENNNCGGLGEAGDICLQGGGGGTTTKANLKFVIAGPHANTAEIQKMKIGIGNAWDCPSDYHKDFPDFDASCEYVPTTPGNVIQVEDHNHLARTWNYSITVKVLPGDACDPTEVDPIIENGGGNSASEDDPP